MGADAGHRGPVPADLDGADPGAGQQLADGHALRFGQSAKGKVAAVDLDGCMQLWSGFLDAQQNLQHEPRPVFRGAPVFILPVVDRRADEPAQKEKVGRVNLNPVKAGLFGPHRRPNELIPNEVNFIYCHLIRLGLGQAALLPGAIIRA